MEFKDKLKKLRSEAGISQTEIAKKIFVSRSAVAKWENGLGLPSDESLALLAEFFNIPAEQLVSDVETENICIDKNKKILKQKNIAIIFLSLFLAVFFSFAVTVIYYLTFADYDPFITKVIDQIKYTRIKDGNEEYYRIDGLHSTSSKKLVIFENEVNGLPVKCINDNAFALTSLGEVYFNDNLTKIGNQSFFFTDIEKLYLNEGLTELGRYSFNYSSLVEVDLPSSLEVIGYGAFYGCNRMERISFGESLKLIEPFAFSCCHRLSNATFKSNLKIEECAFTDTGLKELVFLQPAVTLEDAGFTYSNFLLNKITYNGTLAQFNNTFNRESVGRDVIYLKLADSEDYYECRIINGKWQLDINKSLK